MPDFEERCYTAARAAAEDIWEERLFSRLEHAIDGIPTEFDYLMISDSLTEFLEERDVESLEFEDRTIFEGFITELLQDRLRVTDPCLRFCHSGADGAWTLTNSEEAERRGL